MINNFTNPWENLNNNTWQYKVQVAILVSNCTVLLVTFFVGITANLFVTYAVYNQKSLQTSTNALLVNLAVIDLLRCATDCPLLLVIVLNGNKTRDLGDLVCDGQVMSFSFSCCVQLFTLASISAERHQAIANPFKTAERRKRVTVWIPLTWAVAVVVSALCVIFTKDSSVYLRCKAFHWNKIKTYGSFGRYVLLPVWFLCLALIIGFYSHIFKLVKAHNRKIFDQGVSTLTYKIIPEDKKKVEEVKVSVIEPVSPKEIMQEANDTKSRNGDSKEQKTLTRGQLLVIDTKNLDVKTESPFRYPNQQNVIFVSELQHNNIELIDLENNCNNSVELSEDAEKPSSDELPSDVTDQRNGEEKQGKSSEHEGKPNSPQEADKVQTASAGQTIQVMGEVCMMPSFSSKERGSKRKESKLAKRSGYIICTFLVLWMPLIGTVLLNTFINRKQIWEEIEVLVVSISCMTSLTNPIIYAAVNPQFRTEFYSMKESLKVYCMKS